MAIVAWVRIGAASLSILALGGCNPEPPWQGWVYPDRGNLSKSIDAGRGVELAVWTPSKPAPPPPPPPPPPNSLRFVITQPDWLRKPTPEETNRHFPDRALRLEKAGRATLHCKVKADGTLEECTVVSETPADLQFGKAALEMVPLFKMKTETRDGEPVAGKAITVPVVFPLP